MTVCAGRLALFFIRAPNCEAVLWLGDPLCFRVFIVSHFPSQVHEFVTGVRQVRFPLSRATPLRVYGGHKAACRAVELLAWPVGWPALCAVEWGGGGVGGVVEVDHALLLRRSMWSVA